MPVCVFLKSKNKVYIFVTRWLIVRWYKEYIFESSFMHIKSDYRLEMAL